MIDTNAYRQMMTDPSCTLEDVIMAYARDNIDVARQMTNNHATVSEPMDYQELVNYLSDLDPVAILALGHNSPQFDSSADWFTISWDDEIVPITDEEADKWFLENFHEAVVPLILEGSIPLPSDIQRIISLWNHRGFSPSDYDLPPYTGRRKSKTPPKAKVKPKSKFEKERKSGPVKKKTRQVQRSQNMKPATSASKGKTARKPIVRKTTAGKTTAAKTGRRAKR